MNKVKIEGEPIDGNTSLRIDPAAFNKYIQEAQVYDLNWADEVRKRISLVGRAKVMNTKTTYIHMSDGITLVVPTSSIRLASTPTKTMTRAEMAQAFKDTLNDMLDKRNSKGYKANNFNFALMDTAKLFKEYYGYNEAIAVAKAAGYAVELKGFRTRLPRRIRNADEALTFITELCKNHEEYHPEDDARDIVWNLPEHQQPNKAQCKQLNRLMDDIYSLEGNEDRSKLSAFNPCSTILRLTKNR